ncbi:hypothetical protein OE749_17565 [Aestuariibacter sp. AA17]|uniref:Uncharacterized protein n=1 Tax=Fluctibacter corallii TaxID=2984329 RepID=A0ABT3ACU5_9ALTE|nr:hypothetical protein [Aestuariibacter sp. AA17]MCV2886508.1 hypothetical protein [Aestuariibacter sp. AA17]
MKVLKLFVLLLLFMALFAFLYYGETSIKEGHKYGLSVGDDKDKVYGSLNKFLSEIKGARDKVFIKIKVSEGSSKLLVTDVGFDIFVEPFFHKKSGEDFKENDRWVFYLNASSMDIVELRFDKGKLSEIYRNRRLIELP